MAESTRLLMLCDRFPNPSHGGSVRPFHLIRHLTRQFSYRITLLSLANKGLDPRLVAEVQRHCAELRTVEVDFGDSTIVWLAQYLRNVLSRQNLTRDQVFLTASYVPELQNEIDGLLSGRKFNAIYSTGPLAPLLYGIDLPKIVEPLDAYSEDCLHALSTERNLLRKALWLMQFLQTKGRESIIFRDFDFSIAVTPDDARRLGSGSRKSNIKIIPNGVDASYFRPSGGNGHEASLVFVGGMGVPKNVQGILRFYTECYPTIVEDVPDVKLYLVGRKPAPAIRRLASDPSVVVTGEVPDVRPYLERAAVAIVPIWAGTGIKNKVLEAMCMRKPVVSTSRGAWGIEARPGEHILIEDDPGDFSQAVIGVLKDRELRQTLATNGRLLVEKRYSWERVAASVHSLFRSLLDT